MKRFAIILLSLIVILVASILLYFQFGDCGVSPLSCGDYSTEGKYVTTKIEVSGGPEDIAIDTSLGYERIIVACSERRKEVAQKGRFFSILPSTKEVQEMQVINANVTINPHGIDIITMDSIPYLYAISHNENEEGWRHFVARFVIQGDSLIMDQDHIFEHPLMSVPNDLEVLEDGSFYASNYIPNENSIESTKAVLGIKNGSIVHYDGNENWEIALDNLCYPNGIWVNQATQELVFANGGCQEVLRYKITADGIDKSSKISTRKEGMDIPIGDNLMMDDQGVIWLTAHPCPLKFLDHGKDSQNHSPIQIFALDPQTMKADLVLQNNGDLISAASTAIRIKDRLFLSQVYDPYILAVDGVDF